MSDLFEIDTFNDLCHAKSNTDNIKTYAKISLSAFMRRCFSSSYKLSESDYHEHFRDNADTVLVCNIVDMSVSATHLMTPCFVSHLVENIARQGDNWNDNEYLWIHEVDTKYVELPDRCISSSNTIKGAEEHDDYVNLEPVYLKRRFLEIKDSDDADQSERVFFQFKENDDGDVLVYRTTEETGHFLSESMADCFMWMDFKTD